MGFWPSCRLLGFHAQVGKDFANKVIKELREDGGITSPGELMHHKKENKKKKKFDVLGPLETHTLLSMRAENP